MDQESRQINQSEIKTQRQPIFNFLPPATLFLLFLMIIVAILRIQEPDGVLPGYVYYSAFDLERDYSSANDNLGHFFYYWQFIAYQFLHAGAFHLLMNSGMLIQAGPIAEIGLIPNANPLNIRQLSSERGFWRKKLVAFIMFVIVFLVSGAAGAYGFALLNKGKQYLLMGASGSISGIYAAFLWAAYKMIPNKKRVYSLVFGAIVVFLVVNVIGAAFARNAGFVAIAWEAHLIGFLAGGILYPIFWKLVRI